MQVEYGTVTVSFGGMAGGIGGFWSRRVRDGNGAGDQPGDDLNGRR
jgi:hypothetical protein